ncbi:hsdR [Enterobacter hormaechei]|nr:hsdR [Enterobacter hormaechei]
MFDDDYDSAGTPRPPELTPDVQALINNGLEFLDKAREELEASKAKFSVVSFWTAVEILLKVPLVHEHWTLVCSGKKIVRSNYLAGDFLSVTYDETCAKLGDVLEKPLSKETMVVFDKIRRHRNRVVHFYHPSFTPAEQHQIQKEQADAWFALNRLMRDEWQYIFGLKHSYNWKLAYGETRLLRGSEYYAAVRLKHVQPELDEHASQGIDIQTCPECKQKSMVTLPEATGSTEHTLFVTRCLVCTSLSRHISFTCPECQEPQTVTEGDEPFTCENCDWTEDRIKLLDEESFRSPDETMYSNLPGGCTNCSVPDSVCEHGDGYLCTLCFSFYKELEACDCCGHLSDNVPSLSVIRGCNFCSGDQRYHDD